MELRDYTRILRRNVVLICLAPILVAVAAFFAANAQTRQYSATAEVLLRPNDPNEQLGSQTITNSADANDLARYVEAQANVARGSEVRNAAAKRFGDQLTADDLDKAVKVTALTNANILRITTLTAVPESSVNISDAIALEFIENRRQHSVVGLQQALGNINQQLADVQAILAESTSQTVGVDASQSAQAVLDTAKVRYQSLSDRKQELEININLKRGEAELIQPAQLPKAPASPRPARNSVIGGILGLLTAVGVAMARERFDTRIRDRSQVEQLSGLVTLAEVPTDKRAAKSSGWLPARDDAKGLVAESFRSLRVGIRFLSLDKPISVLVVTSPTPGDGKSFVAANLAVSYASSGARTLLVSGDLRRPQIDSLFVGQLDYGVTDALVELADHRRHFAGHDFDLSDFADPADAENLWVLHAGTRTPNPVETLGSAAMGQLITRARETFDIIIIDTPPLLLVADALVLAAHADGILLVASARKTTRQAVERAAETLGADHLNVLGTVVNRVSASGQGREYGYDHTAYHDRAEKDVRVRTPAKPLPPPSPSLIRPAARGSVTLSSELKS